MLLMSLFVLVRVSRSRFVVSVVAVIAVVAYPEVDVCYGWKRNCGNAESRGCDVC